MRYTTFESFVSILTSLALVLGNVSMAYAQQIIVDPTAPGTVLIQNGNVPQINIATPQSGVSLNTFEEYNVDQNGLILNNSISDGTAQIGVGVTANPNLMVSGPATTIVNEVTGTNSSTLAGTTEVFGVQADVIIANPNGLECSGCEFLNTGKTTLTTGRPIVTPQGVDLSVVTGQVSIAGDGVSAGEAFAIHAQGISIGGDITTTGGEAQSVGLFSGSQYVGADGQIRDLPELTTSISPYGIDITENAVISSGDVTVQSFGESTNDVNAFGQVISTGDTVLRSQGDLFFADITAGGDISASAGGDIRAYGDVTAEGTITSLSDSFTVYQGRVVDANGDITLTGREYLLIAGEVFGQNVTLTTNAQDVFNNGFIFADEQLTIYAGDGVQQTRHLATVYDPALYPALQQYIEAYQIQVLRGGPEADLAAELLVKAQEYEVYAEYIADGATMAAKNIYVQSLNGDIKNTGGAISSIEDTILIAARDVVNTYLAHRTRVADIEVCKASSGCGYRTDFHAGEIIAGRDLVLQAAQDVEFTASDAAAHRNLQISAGGLVDISSEVAFYVSDNRNPELLSLVARPVKPSSRTVKGNARIEYTRADDQSAVFGASRLATLTGDIGIAAGSDIALQGTQISAGNDLVLQAVGSIFMSEHSKALLDHVERKWKWSWTYEHNPGSDHGETTIRTKTATNTVRVEDFSLAFVSTELIGKNVAVMAGQDVITAGLRVFAGEDLVISAENGAILFESIDLPEGMDSPTVASSEIKELSGDLARSIFGPSDFYANPLVYKDNYSAIFGTDTDIAATIEAAVHEDLEAILGSGLKTLIEARADFETADILTEAEMLQDWLIGNEPSEAASLLERYDAGEQLNDAELKRHFYYEQIRATIEDARYSVLLRLVREIDTYGESDLDVGFAELVDTLDPVQTNTLINEVISGLLASVTETDEDILSSIEELSSVDLQFAALNQTDFDALSFSWLWAGKFTETIVNALVDELSTPDLGESTETWTSYDELSVNDAFMSTLAVNLINDYITYGVRRDGVAEFEKIDALDPNSENYNPGQFDLSFIDGDEDLQRFVLELSYLVRDAIENGEDPADLKAVANNQFAGLANESLLHELSVRLRGTTIKNGVKELISTARVDQQEMVIDALELVPMALGPRHCPAGNRCPMDLVYQPSDYGQKIQSLAGEMGVAALRAKQTEYAQNTQSFRDLLAENDLLLATFALNRMNFVDELASRARSVGVQTSSATYQDGIASTVSTALKVITADDDLGNASLAAALGEEYFASIQQAEILKTDESGRVQTEYTYLQDQVQTRTELRDVYEDQEVVTTVDYYKRWSGELILCSKTQMCSRLPKRVVSIEETSIQSVFVGQETVTIEDIVQVPVTVSGTLFDTKGDQDAFLDAVAWRYALQDTVSDLSTTPRAVIAAGTDLSVNAGLDLYVLGATSIAAEGNAYIEAGRRIGMMGAANTNFGPTSEYVIQELLPNGTYSTKKVRGISGILVGSGNDNSEDEPNYTWKYVKEPNYDLVTTTLTELDVFDLIGEELVLGTLYDGGYDTQYHGSGSSDADLGELNTISAGTKNYNLTTTTISAGDLLSVSAGESFVNYGASLVSGDDLIVSAEEHVRNHTVRNNFTLTKEHDCGHKACGTLGHDYKPAEMLSGGSLIVTAGQNIENKGSVISAASTLMLQAGDNISNEAVTSQYLYWNENRCTGSFLGVCHSRKRKKLSRAMIAEGILATQFGDIYLEAGQEIASIGSTVSAGGTIEMTASDVSLSAVAEETVNYARKSGFSFLSYSDNRVKWNEFQTAYSTVEANNISINATNNIIGIGSQIIAAGDVDLIAGNDLTLDAHQNDKYEIRSGWSFGISFGGSTILQAIAEGDDVLEAYVSTNPTLAAVYQLGTAKDRYDSLNGLIALGYHLPSTLSNVRDRLEDQSAGSLGVDWSGGAVTGALFDELNPFSWMSSNAIFDGMPGARKDAVAGGFLNGITFRIGGYEMRRDWTESFVTHLVAGNNLWLDAGNDMALVGGTVATAGRHGMLYAGNDLIVTALSDTSSSEGSNWGASLGFTSTGVTVGVEAGRSMSDAILYTNASISAAEDLDIITGRHALIAGGNIEAENIYMDVAGDLTLASKQNWSDSDASGFNFSVTFGPSGVSGFSVGGYENTANRNFTDTPSSIVADNRLSIYAGGTTTLLGSTLKSKVGNLKLDTGTLLFSNFTDTETSEYKGFGLTVGVTDTFTMDPTQSDLNGSYSFSSKTGVTYATVGAGEITVRDWETFDFSELNRNTDVIQEIISDKSFSIAIPGINITRWREDLKGAKALVNAVAAKVPDNVRSQGEQAVSLYKRMLFNGVSITDAQAQVRTPEFVAAVEQARKVALLDPNETGSIAAERRILALNELAVFENIDGELATKLRVECDLFGTRCEFVVGELSEILSDEDRRGLLTNTLEDQVESIKNSAATEAKGDLEKNLFEALVLCAVYDPVVYADFVTRMQANGDWALVTAMAADFHGTTMVTALNDSYAQIQEQNAQPWLTQLITDETAARETLIESLYNNNADALRNLSNAYAGIELENALVNLDILLSTELSDPGITPERAALVEEMRSNSDALLAALNAEPGATSTAMVAGMADALLEMGIEVSGSALDLAWNNVTDGEMGLSEFTSEAILISTALAVVTGVKLSRIWKNGLDRSFQNPWLDQNGSVPNFRDEFVIDPKKFEYIFGGVTSGTHNQARSGQLQSVMSKLGYYNDTASVEALTRHFRENGAKTSQVVKQFTKHIDGVETQFYVTESVLSGPGGFVKLSTTYELLPNGSYKFVTTVPFK